MWGLIGIRLRTSADDFPDDPAPTPDPVDPVPPDSESPQKTDRDAIRSGDPVDSEKVDHELKTADASYEAKAEEFGQNDRITGSAPAETDGGSLSSAPLPHDPAATLSPTNPQQSLLMDNLEDASGKMDVLQYYPDLMLSSTKRRSN